MSYTTVRSAEDFELGNADMIESGYGDDFPRNPAFSRSILYMPAPAPLGRPRAAMGDYPLVRPSGPEPELGLFDGLSNNERKFLMIGGVAAAAFLLFKNRERFR